MGVKARILASVSAWLAGAAVATGGTLVAISWIGQGISTAPVRTLSVDQVTNALAGISPSPDGTGDDPAGPASGPAAASPAQSASRSAGGATTSPPTTLTSAGGSLIAVCTAAGAYLTSWSPAENFQVDEVQRGPARVARVVFQSGSTDVYLGVVCHDGLPTAYSGHESQGPDN